MKPIFLSVLNIRKHLLIVVCLFITIALTAQETEPSDLKDFKIVIENTKNGLKMQGVEGTVWKDLSFTISKNKPQAINTYGMTKVNEVPIEVEDKYTHFLFTITKTSNGVELKGLEGTAWVELSITFSFDSEKVMLDQYGIKNIY
jgi:hypothetical protein